jgi:hypothetical protein
MSINKQKLKRYGSAPPPLGEAGWGPVIGWVGALAILKFLLPFLLVHQPWELHRDEYLYYAQGQHLAFGYLECPPLVGWLGYIASLFGGSFFWVKFFPSLFGAVMLLVTAGMVKEMGGRTYAQVLAALGIIFSAYMRTNFLLQPVFLEIFFWTLSIYYLLRLINTQHPRYYYLLSAAITLSWYSKYSALFFICGVGAALLLTYHRKLLASRHLWMAAAMALLLILPNIHWQYSHNWPLAHHMQELRETQLQYVSKTDFLKGQLGLLLPVTFVWLAGLVWLIFQRKFRLLAYTYLAVMVLLMLGSGKDYYALGVYPMLLAAGGVFVEKMSVRQLWVRYVVVAIVLALSYPYLYIGLPIEQPEAMAATNRKHDLAGKGLTKWEDQQTHPLIQDFADMLGWREMTTKTERSYDSLTAKGYRNIEVYTGNYGQAGALQYYAKNDAFRQKVTSRNGTFLLWIHQPLRFSHVLLIDDEWPEVNEPVFQHFSKVVLLDSVANPLSRQLGDKIFLLENADSVAVQFVNAEIEEKRRLFSRH